MLPTEVEDLSAGPLDLVHVVERAVPTRRAGSAPLPAAAPCRVGLDTRVACKMSTYHYRGNNGAADRLVGLGTVLADTATAAAFAAVPACVRV